MLDAVATEPTSQVGCTNVRSALHCVLRTTCYSVHHDDEITSDELDQLLDEAETLPADRPAGPTEMRLYVAIDENTLHELEQRAADTGTDVTGAASDALQAGMRAA